jgi:hypothetical protein
LHVEINNNESPVPPFVLELFVEMGWKMDWGGSLCTAECEQTVRRHTWAASGRGAGDFQCPILRGRYTTTRIATALDDVMWHQLGLPVEINNMILPIWSQLSLR